MNNSNFLDVSLAAVCCAHGADARQKAIALVQKAIDEDVKQNYAVRLPSPAHC